MATPHRRISVILTPEVDAALKRLRAASGLSPSGYVRQVLDQSVTLIDRMASAFEVAKRNPEAGIVALQELTESVNVTAAQLSLDMGKVRKRVRRARRRRD